MSTASVGSAVQHAVLQAKQKLLQMAINDQQSPVYGADWRQLELNDGKLFLKSAPANGESITSMLSRNQKQSIDGFADVKPELDPKKFSCHSFGAVFAEVTVDPVLCIVRTRRVVAVFDVGRIMNEKLARSQFIGGIVWGVSLVLLENTDVDPRNGQIMNPNLADYLVPINADIGEIDVSALE